MITCFKEEEEAEEGEEEEKEEERKRKRKKKERRRQLKFLLFFKIFPWSLPLEHHDALLQNSFG